MYKYNPKILSFLKESVQYNVLHEKSFENQNLEHYFILVTKKDTEHSIVEDCLNEYEKDFPLIDISKISISYLISKNKEYHYIYIDTLDKRDVFFLEKEELLKNNTHNIIALRIIGEAIDLKKHIESNGLKYFSQFKQLSYSFGILAKEEVKSGINLGFKKIIEKKPIFQEKINQLKKKIIK